MTSPSQTTATVESYLELLEQSNLLTEQQMSRFCRKFDVRTIGTAEDLARRLVHERVLTPFQAERLLEGRYRGFIIDRYRIREILGVGGMGCVFIAEDSESKEKIALKVLSSQFSTDAGMLTRMRLEGWAGMQIDHPNVVRTHRVGSTGAVNFLVMDLKRAISLHEMVALGGPVKPQMACDMFHQAALGIQAAHDCNIVHRDIKPANLLIDHSGQTSVLDFGLALVGSDKAEEFSLAMIFGHDCLGTPDYIAPEQSLDSDKVDGRADIYSLGCTMYVALTGRVPFADCKTNSEKLDAQRKRNAAPAHSVNPDVPIEISDVVARMMSRDVRRRYQTATDVAAALKPFAKQQSVKFDFRKLITIRARLARQREVAENRSQTASRSNITSTLSWIDQPSHHLRTTGDTFTGDETPTVGQVDRAAETAVRPTSPISSSGKMRGVPTGWSLRSLKTNRRTPLRTSVCRIGRSQDSDIRVKSLYCDEIQCTLEFNGKNWHLKQDSMTWPTYVDGKLIPYTKLKSGTKLTFRDDSGFTLEHSKHNSNQPRLDTASRWYLTMAFSAGFLSLAALGAVIWLLFR